MVNAPAVKNARRSLIKWGISWLNFMAASAHSNDIVPVGVYASAVTPHRKQQQRIDSGAALEVIDFLNQSPVDGMALLGVAGGYPHFDVEEREKFIAFALRRARKPTAVNVSHSSLEVTAYLASHAAACGASLILVMPPHFYRYSAAQVESYYRALRAAVHPQVPLYLYRVPYFASDLSLAAAQRLLAEGHYAGLVDASHDSSHLASLGSSPGVKILGNEAAWPTQRRFAHAVLSACAAAIPELVAALDRAFLAADAARINLLLQRLAEFTAWIDRFPVPFGFMEAARLRGLPVHPDPTWLADAPLAAFRDWFPAWLPAAVRDAKG